MDDLTGALSVYFIQQTLECEILRDMINESGGITIGGQKYLIKTYRFDNQSTVDGAAAAAAKLVYDYGIKFSIGPYGAPSAAADPIFEENKVIACNQYPMGTPGEVSKDTPYQFATGYGVLGSAFMGVNGLKKYYPDAKTIVNMQLDQGSVQKMTPLVVALEESLGYTVLNNKQTLSWTQDMSDLTSYADKVNQLKPDCVVMFDGTVTTSGSFIKRLRELGNNVPFYYPATIGGQYLIDLLGPTANDILTTGVIMHSPNNPSMLEAVQGRLGTTAVQGSMVNTMSIMLYIIKQANSLDADAFKTTFENAIQTGPDDTLYGVTFFGGEKTYGIRHGVGFAAPFQQIKNGKIIDAGWVSTGPIP